MKILVIIPTYNEEQNIEKVITDLVRQIPEADYLVVDDCSGDNTLEVCKRNHYNFISLPINLGIGAAVQAGYKYALEKGYEIAVQHDGDGQHDPKYIKEVIQPIESGICDIVIGSRFLDKQGFQSSLFRRAGINLLSNLIYLCCGTRVKDVTSGFRAVNKRYIEFYARNYSMDYPEPEAIIAAGLNGAKIQEIPVIMRQRENGVSPIDMIKSIYYMIKVSTAIIIRRLVIKKK